jgi:hypothetical protein
MSEERAWVRDLQYGTDFIVPIARCSRIMTESRETQP